MAAAGAPVTLLRRGVETGVALVLVLLAALGAHRLYQGWGFAFSMGGAAVFATLVATLLGLRRLPLSMTAVASIIGYFLFTAYASLGSTMPLGVPTPTTIGDTIAGITDGWRAILDSPLPISGSDNRPEVFLGFAAWVTAAVTTEMVTRTRLTVLPVLPAVGLYGLTLAMGAPAERSSLALPALIGIAALAVVMVRTRPSPTTRTHTSGQLPTSRALGLGLVLALMCGIGGMIASTALDDGDPFDPRRFQDARVIEQRSSNPLLEVKATQAIDPPAPVLTIDTATASDAILVDRLPVAVLDEYDGTSWKVVASFSPTAAELTPADVPTVDVADVDQVVRLRSSRHPWIPVGRTARFVDLDDIAYDPDTGMVLAPPGSGPLSYSMVTQVALPGDDELAEATVTPDAALLAVPNGISPELQDLAAELAADLDPYERAVVLESFFQERFTGSADAAAGHSLARLDDFLLDDRTGGAEQFAAAFALLARLEGLPSRVVVGYRLTTSDEDGIAVADAIDTADLDAWAEVRFDGVGWLAFDPAPFGAGENADDPSAPTTTLATEVIDREVFPTAAGPDDRSDDDASEDSGPDLVVPVLVALGLLAVAGTIGAIRGAKRTRRNERELTGTAADRVVGAWYDATDRLVEHGLAVTSNMTFADITEAGIRRFSLPAGSELWELLPRVAEAAYGPERATRRGAAEAWEHAARFRTELNRRRSRGQRLVAWLSIRPLRRPDLPANRSRP